ncbi:gll3880 [Gloeobacter violaceus PCC 7421]|uniref:Gll3880 protein n=1 Tax=Gloeobacter violaceus (strain ATCC 29082 / PCC 7421) TaxID=251221 RepID=Q7NEJ9_GLOVI|nr:gll3880 [Gloeobacter violaceus PCC 7421]
MTRFLSPSKSTLPTTSRPSSGPRVLELYRWVGWLSLASGAFALLLSSYFYVQIDHAVREEQTLAQDAGLSAVGLQQRLGQLRRRTSRLETLKLNSQVQALQLLTRLAARESLVLAVQFHRQPKAGELLCTASTVGSESNIWNFLANLDELHTRSRGSVSLRSYEFDSTEAGKVQLRVAILFLTRTPQGGSP